MNKVEERMGKLEKSMIARIDEKFKEIKPGNVVQPPTDDISFQDVKHAQKIKALQAEVDLLNREIEEKDKSIQALTAENKALKQEIGHRDQVFRNQEQKMKKMNMDLNLLEDKSKKSVQTTDEMKENSLQLQRDNEILCINIKHLMEEAMIMKTNLEFAQSLALQGKNTINGKSNETRKMDDQHSAVDECIIVGDSLVKQLNTDWLLSTPTDEIVDALVKAADQAKQRSQKVVVSTITPRYDHANLNIKAQLINATLQEKLAKKQGISINDNSNLNVRPNNTGKFYSDDKLHLSEQGNRMFAQNVKLAICEALDITAAPPRERSKSPQFKKPRHYNYKNYNN
eukprot:Seg2999.3 transcript_id=Seg2999.3/GoldUCD/mRNA.D3Y31 product="hypothetical protein" protein_id=Seg2999.3/GoldUCD/D3Y31